MIVEFERDGKTYRCVVGAPTPPPATIQVAFRPCPLKPPMFLELVFRGHDEIRGIELYRPLTDADLEREQFEEWWGNRHQL